METRLVKLSFQSPVHFGSKRISDGEMHIKSDTLFSALFIESLNLGIDVEFLLNDLLISDTFPYSEQTYYLPKPLITVESNNKEESNYKAFIKLSYIPYDRYNDYLNGQIRAEEAEAMNDTFNVGSYHLVTKASIEGPVSETTKSYSVGAFTFHKGSGIYFIVRANDQTFTKLETVLNSLQYSGIGGKRSSGFGKFTYEIVREDDFLGFLNQKGKRYVLLSTSMAEDEKIEDIKGDHRFILVKRSGFVQSTSYASTFVKKRDFYAFSVGSVFEEKFNGNIFDVSDGGNHPVYQYAKAFWLEV